MKIKLKQRKLKNGIISLFLEYYKGYTVKENGKIKHFRSQEKLNLFIPENPKNKQERDSRKETLEIAEKILVKRQAEINEEDFSFLNKKNKSLNFIDYIEKIANSYKGSYKHNWISALKQLINFNQSNYLPFKSIDVKYLNDFKEYLINEPLVYGTKPLSTNTIQSYFNKIRIALKKAYDEKLISENIAMRVKSVKGADTSREYLTIEEIQKMANTECRYEVLKKAFLFSCITGLRWSDINNLKWKDIEKSNGKYRILFRQKKTKGFEYLDIPNQAREIIGQEREQEERVFKGLRYSAYFNTELLKWAMKAGISKHITFHSARHSFATMQLTLGTDLYTVSKLLGHKNISTTQIYAKIIDSKKQEAMNKIPEFNYKKTNNISENK